MRQYDLYLFDFDNTLFDTTNGIEAILRDALPVLGLDYSKERFRECLGMSLDSIFHMYCEDESRYDEYIKVCNEVVYSDAYLGARPFPDARTVLERLYELGIPIGIATGKASFKVDRLLKDNGLDHITSAIVGWFETERHKPDPQPLEKVFSMFDVQKEKTIYVGDSPNDSLAAKAFGVDVAIVDRGDGTSPGDIPCTYPLKSLEELLDF